MDYSSAFRINRNIVECKDKYGAITAEAESSINRNIVECKVGRSLPLYVYCSSINRNIVECKVPLHLPQSVEALVLIETLWNVKKGGYVVKILGAEVY